MEAVVQLNWFAVLFMHGTCIPLYDVGVLCVPYLFDEQNIVNNRIECTYFPLFNFFFTLPSSIVHGSHIILFTFFSTVETKRSDYLCWKNIVSIVFPCTRILRRYLNVVPILGTCYSMYFIILTCKT